MSQRQPSVGDKVRVTASMADLLELGINKWDAVLLKVRTCTITRIDELCIDITSDIREPGDSVVVDRSVPTRNWQNYLEIID